MVLVAVIPAVEEVRLMMPLPSVIGIVFAPVLVEACAPSTVSAFMANPEAAIR